MLELVCEDIKALAPDARLQMAERAGAPGAPEVVTAAPLPTQAADRFKKRLAMALGAPVEPTFKADPALIAGVEVAIPVHHPAPVMGLGPATDRSRARR